MRDETILTLTIGGVITLTMCICMALQTLEAYQKNKFEMIQTLIKQESYCQKLQEKHQ